MKKAFSVLTRPVLLVEDYEPFASAFKAFYENAGIPNRLVHAKDGEEAISMVWGNAYSDKAVVPALVVMDVGLPHLLGTDVIKMFHYGMTLYSVKVIAITATKNSVTADFLERLDIPYIEKSEDLKPLMEKIKELLSVSG